MFAFFTSILWYKKRTKTREIIPQKSKYEVVFKILKNLKSNLRPKKVILCSPTLKDKHAFPKQSFSRPSFDHHHALSGAF